MTFDSLRNFACVAGMVIGATLIMGADIARADVRPCTAEEAGDFETPGGLPLICETMTVTANRTELLATVADGAKKGTNEDALIAAASLRAEAVERVESQNWATELVS